MIGELAQAEVQQWIQQHLSEDPARLLLSGNKQGKEFPFREAVQQIAARQKARIKLPDWYQNPAVIFPPGLSVEQSSSELTASYKAGWLKELNGGPVASLADLTGGMGVDSYYFSKVTKNSIYVETQPELAELAQHNFSVLNADIEVKQSTAEEFLISNQKVDWLYLDPARRDEQQRKLVSLHDCRPDVIELLPQLLNKAEKGIILKASPMLDVQLACQELQGKVHEVRVIAVRQEVKELLFYITKEEIAEPKITAVILDDKGEPVLFSFFKREETEAAPNIAEPQTYLYEPNVTLLKAGAFKLAATRFGLIKLHPHSHLYTNVEQSKDFPGRVYEILYVGKPDKKTLRKLVPQGANVSVRNYPQPAEVLAKKLQVAPNSQYTVFGTTLSDGKPSVIVGRWLK